MDALTRLNDSLVGRYQIDREIGRGGMATVYLARDVKHDRFVALKVLDPELGSALWADRFLSEIRVTATLQHPNLLPLFDSGAAEGLLYYVMPYVEGESLRVLLDRERQLPVSEAVRIAAAVADALDYAHARGVIHRDLKPENILLQHGQPVVADFGIALALSNAGGARVTQTGLSLGTPQYMSPEQATGDRQIDRRADVYSLGAVTYEMLTGDPPHTGSSVQAIIARVVTEQPRGVRAVRPAVAEHVAFAVEKALEKLPADRWATAREFRDALQIRTSVARTREASPRLTHRQRLRDPVLLGLIALTVLLVAALGAAFRWSTRDAGEEVQYSVVTRGEATLANANFPLALSPDGRLLAYVGRNGIYIRAAADVRARVIPGTNGASTPFFSPDGTWLGFFAQGKLMRVAVSGGMPEELADIPHVSHARWGRDGTIVFGDGRAIYAVSASGGVPRPISRPDTARGETSRMNPLVLGDGKTVVYASLSGTLDSARLAVTTIDGARPVRLDLLGVAALGVVDDRLIYAQRDGALMAVPFDVRGRRVAGVPVVVARDLRVQGGNVLAALSPGGTLAYVLNTELAALQLVLVDETGAAQPILAEPRYYDLPRLSPDGKRLAVYIDPRGYSGTKGDYWIYEFAAGTLSRLTSDSADHYYGEWLPGSRALAFTRGQTQGIWQQPVDGSGPATPILVDGKQHPFAVSPDGRSLIYTEYRSREQGHLMVRGLTGDTMPLQLPGYPGGLVAYRFSPDGRWLAYVSPESGRDEVYVRRFPGAGPRVQITSNGGEEPVWSRDGRRLFFRGGEAARTLYAATVATAPAFTVLSRKKLFEGQFDWTWQAADYDVAADGKHFVMVQLPTDDKEIVVSLNWREELRQRLDRVR